MGGYINKGIFPQRTHSLMGKPRYPKLPILMYNLMGEKYSKNREGQSLGQGNVERLLRPRARVCVCNPEIQSHWYYYT